MKREAREPAALEKRAQPGGLRAIFLAVVVHVLFFGLIVFGVTWQSSPSPPVQAELWDKLPPTSKPVPPKREPPKPEPPKPEPPKPKLEPPKPDVKPEPPKPDPEIALKAEREKRERLENEKRERLEKDKRDRLEKQKQEDAKKKREQEEAARRKREEEEAARREAERVREVAATARQREFDRFVNAIRGKIRSRANVPDTVSGKPSVQVHIRILPGGDVLDIRIVKSSGNRVYDTAIERAIRSAQPLPVPAADSELFPQFRDLILNIEHER